MSKAKRPDTVIMTKAQVEEMRMEAITNAVSIMLAAQVIALRDLFGWGAVRLNRFVDRVKNMLSNGDLTMDDVIDHASELLGKDIMDNHGQDKPLGE
jgi:hypothetical protein